MDALEQAERIVRDYPTDGERFVGWADVVYVIGAFAWLFAWWQVWRPR